MSEKKTDAQQEAGGVTQDAGEVAPEAAQADAAKEAERAQAEREAMQNLHVILASQSPRRKDLLEAAGVKFTVRVPDADETLTADLASNPQDAVKQLAERKAGVVVQELLADEGLRGAIVVIGADTMVVLNCEIFGKPKNFSDAKGMLRKLSGNTHHVMTGVSMWLIMATDPENVSVGMRSFVDISEVTFNKLTDDQIDEYIKKGESYDKAGAYAAQGEGRALIQQIDGHEDTVIGLPVERMVKEFPDLLGLKS